MKRLSGFSLSELIYSIAILSIVLSFGIPQIAFLFKQYKNEAKAWELFELLILMRTKAYSERRSYSLCPNSDNYSCGKNWSSGAILFADDNGDGKLDLNEKIERIYPKLEEGSTLSWNAFNNRGAITFRPDGTTPAQSGHFKYCPASGKAEYGWIIILNAIGRPYFGKDSDGDGIVEDGSGKALQCDTGSS